MHLQSPHGLAVSLRTTLQRLEKESPHTEDDPPIDEMRRILLQRIAEVEVQESEESSSHGRLDDSRPQLSFLACGKNRR
jgi:hypothetical protein